MNFSYDSDSGTFTIINCEHFGTLVLLIYTNNNTHKMLVPGYWEPGMGVGSLVLLLDPGTIINCGVFWKSVTIIPSVLLFDTQEYDFF